MRAGQSAHLNPAGGVERSETHRLRVLQEHPELLPAAGLAVQTGDIRAEGGSVAAAVLQGATVTIHNSK